MQVHANGTLFFMGTIFPVEIKLGKGEKSLSHGQIRYTIRIIYMCEKNHSSWIYRQRDI